MKTWLAIALGILIGLAAAGALWLVTSPPQGIPILLNTPAPPSPVTVQVLGGVAKPGVYTLPYESRTQDAIQAAGGLLAEVDPATVNLAAMLSDGQRLVIPLPGDTPADPAAKNAGSVNLSAPININTATIEEMSLLPGIGTGKAQEIIKYRESNGPFGTPADIQNVSGIGPALYEKIKDLIVTQ